MNPRIQELYEAAQYKAGSQKTWNTTNRDVAEQFAKLLVQECGKVIEAHFEPVYDGKLLNEYFGIER